VNESNSYEFQIGVDDMEDRPNYPVPANPNYNPLIPIILDDDLVRASTTTNPINERLIENIHYLKQEIIALNAKIAALTGFSISGSVDSHSDLPDIDGLLVGTLFVVRNDENHNGRTTINEVTETGWAFVAYLEIDLSKIENDISILFNYVDTFNALIDVAISTRAPANTALSTAQWTNARAALLDNLNQITAARMANLDAAISSRAPANTALSTAQWTNARAALLDQITAARMANLDAAISSRAPANTALSTAQWPNSLAANLTALASGGNATIGVSVQRGVATLTGGTGTTVDVAISSVNLTRSIELSNFSSAEANNSPFISVRLTSSTNLRIQQTGNSGGTNRSIPWIVFTFI